MDPGSLRRLSDQELAELLKKVKGNTTLPRRPMPQVPTSISRMTNLRPRVVAIQQFIKSFEYNHTGTCYIKKKRDRGVKHVMFTAKEIVREGLPIQCVEAVFLGIYLTTGMSELTRYPLSFKSSVKDQSFRHIVLAVQYQNKWGALGISRQDTLMYKDMSYGSLSDLVLEYKQSYEACQHTLDRVYVGLPFLHEGASSDGPIKWRALRLNMEDRTWEDVAECLDRYSKEGPYLAEFYHRAGVLPDDFNTSRGKRGRKSRGEDEDDDAASAQSSDSEAQKPSDSQKPQSRSRQRKTLKSSEVRKGGPKKGQGSSTSGSLPTPSKTASKFAV